ncbi:lysozyme inhibitor LprI family protein [Devosia sp.]|uniref:lysozyme inhibitor LprI family protein n=1 Tax=Devosia sp. TaxID=1871048 RepID=UPI0032639E09
MRQFQRRRYRLALPLLAIALLLFAAMWFAAPAMALDCTRASTPVDHAICDTPALKAADARLGKVYFATLKGLAGVNHDLLIESQRLWLTNREEECVDDVAACVAKSIDERLDAIAVCYAGQPGTTTACSYFTQTTCPTLVGLGWPGMGKYPFLIDTMTSELKHAIDEFDCITDPEIGADASQDSETQTLDLVGERPGLVCLNKQVDGYYSGAAHPFHGEVLQCYETATGQLLPFETVFPKVTAGSDQLQKIRDSIDGELTTTCCDGDITDALTFAEIYTDQTMPNGWATDASGALQLGFEYPAFGRSFQAIATVPRDAFIDAVAPAYRKYFTPAQ